MANIKLTSDYWETTGIYDLKQGKTQRVINNELKNAGFANVVYVDDGSGYVNAKTGQVGSSTIQNHTDYIDVSQFTTRRYT